MDENKKVTYSDRDASWEIYVELITKITTQPLTQIYDGRHVEGDIKSALDSVYSIFPETRLILKKYGFTGKQFSILAFKILNDEIRPFTTKWDGRNLTRRERRLEFREDLKKLQSTLAPYVDKFLKMANTDNKLLDKAE